MDSFEMTKVAGAVLSALLLIVGTKTLVEMTAGHGPTKPGYTLPTDTAAAPAAEGEVQAADASAPATDGPAGEAAAAAPAGGADVLTILAAASADNGKSAFSKCKACHAVEKGKPNGVGPNLYGIVNRAKGAAEGFKYSEALKTKGGNWGFEELSSFLLSPKGYVAGTKMVFNGIPAATDRADMLAYLATLADTPVELPK